MPYQLATARTGSASSGADAPVMVAMVAPAELPQSATAVGSRLNWAAWFRR